MAQGANLVRQRSVQPRKTGMHATICVSTYRSQTKFQPLTHDDKLYHVYIYSIYLNTLLLTFFVYIYLFCLLLSAIHISFFVKL